MLVKDSLKCGSFGSIFHWHLKYTYIQNVTSVLFNQLNVIFTTPNVFY